MTQRDDRAVQVAAKRVLLAVEPLLSTVDVALEDNKLSPMEWLELTREGAKFAMAMREMLQGVKRAGIDIGDVAKGVGDMGRQIDPDAIGDDALMF